MTELQMGLIGLGAAAVVGVLGYNKWQEYRHRKLAEAMLKPGRDDVLLGAAGAASGVRGERDKGAVAPVAAPERREPVLADSLPTGDSGEPVFRDGGAGGDVMGGRPESVAAEALPDEAARHAAFIVRTFLHGSRPINGHE